MEVWEKKDNPEVTVEAIRLNEGNAAEVAAWCGGQLIEEISPEDPEEMQPGINVTTLGAVKRASLGTYVVKYGKNFFVERIRPFEEVYTPASRPSPPPESIADSRKARGFADPFGRT